ncbi:MAG: hypothetical protein SPK61_00335 [Bacteroidales bacterium]|nr:hypothetical protein [Bacteroidales bacterium]
MRNFLIFVIAVTVANIALAQDKVWLYSKYGNHLSMDVAEFDSLSFIAPDNSHLVFPDIPAPAEGKAIVVFYNAGGDRIDCNGIVFNGTDDGGSTVTSVPFEDVKGYEDWYQVELDLAENVFQYRGVDNALYGGLACIDAFGSPSGWYDTSIDNEHGNPELAEMTGNQYLVIKGSGVVYLNVYRFKNNPCTSMYIFKIKLPKLCNESDVPSLVGNFVGSGWDNDVDLELGQDGYWTAVVEGVSTSQYKIRKNGDWNEQLQYKEFINEEYGWQWRDYNDFEFGKNNLITLDFSNDAWRNCLPE